MSSTADDTPVSLSIYWQRAVAFDAQGRVQRRAGGAQLQWHQKLVKDVLGIYHIGVVVHGTEYTFGNSHAPYSRHLGGEAGGIVAHRPGEGGPRNILKEMVHMGSTTATAERVEEVASKLSSSKYQALFYNRLQHNCGDFAQELCACLRVQGEFPAWCHRGAATVRLMVGASGGEAISNTAAAPDAKRKFNLQAFPTRVPQRSRADSALSEISSIEDMSDCESDLEDVPADELVSTIAIVSPIAISRTPFASRCLGFDAAKPWSGSHQRADSSTSTNLDSEDTDGGSSSSSESDIVTV